MLHIVRSHCSESAVHRSPMAGISGSKSKGAYSIVLSAGYKDDENQGDVSELFAVWWICLILTLHHIMSGSTQAQVAGSNGPTRTQ